MIKKVKIAKEETLDQYLLELYQKSQWPFTSRRKSCYLKVTPKTPEEINELCGENGINMWTGATRYMKDALRDNKEIVITDIEYSAEKYTGTTFLAVCTAGLGWDSRVFNILDTETKWYEDIENLIIQE